jgi:hypothetical protein
MIDPNESQLPEQFLDAVDILELMARLMDSFLFDFETFTSVFFNIPKSKVSPTQYKKIENLRTRLTKPNIRLELKTKMEIIMWILYYRCDDTTTANKFPTKFAFL